MGDMTADKIRILLVDDEEDLVEFLSHRLVRRGYHVVGTTSGPEAIAAAGEQLFDIAVIDLKMPEMGGIEVLERLKRIQPYIEAIILTGHGSHESALEAGKLHAQLYLLKPYKYEDLVARIEEAYAVRRNALRSRFDEEFGKIMTAGLSAREIREAARRLRKQYEQ